MLLLGLPVHGHTIRVTVTQDSTERHALRGAIIEANKVGGNNTIILQPGIYRLSIQGADEDGGLTGDLDVTRGRLAIMGAGTNTIIDASGLGDRVFHVLPKARLTLVGLVVSGGTGADRGRLGVDGEDGGGIYNAGTLVLKNCVVTGNLSGDAGSPLGNLPRPGGGRGGGLYNQGTLVVDNCTFEENSCGGGWLGGSGGGIWDAGFAILKNCNIRDNRCGAGDSGDYNAVGYGGNGGSGAGLYNTGRMLLNHCTLSSNAAGQGGDGGQQGGFIQIGTPGGPGGSGGDGGGIYNVGFLKLNLCTVSGNSSGAGGGGIPSTGPYSNGGRGGNGGGIFSMAVVSLNTCTISGNSCGSGGAGGSVILPSGALGGSGGGIYSTGSLTLLSCTICSNSAGNGGTGENSLGISSLVLADGGPGGNGGGISSEAGRDMVLLRNTLVALNSPGSGGLGGTNLPFPGFPPLSAVGVDGAPGSGPDLAGSFTSGGYNLVGVADGSDGFTGSLNGDRVGSTNSPINPLLGPLQDNGGSTLTHALLHGSPAIDQGNSFHIHTDQRGHHRPHKYPSIPDAPGGDGSDIGALELDALSSSHGKQSNR
jgi:hypothetical protein